MVAQEQARPLFFDKDETAMEYLQRMMSWVATEPGDILDDLPTPQAIMDFFDLWKVYDVDGLDAVIEQIEGGADPDPYNSFVLKYGLWRRNIWSVEDAGNWRLFCAEPTPEEEREKFVDAATERLCLAVQEYYTSVLIEPTEDGRRLSQLVIDVTDFAAEVMEQPEPEADGSPATGQYWGLY